MVHDVSPLGERRRLEAWIPEKELGRCSGATGDCGRKENRPVLAGRGGGWLEHLEEKAKEKGD